MKKLSDFFSCIRDIDIQYTHYANSPLQNTACFVLTNEFLTIANQNRNITAIITTEALANDVDTSKGLVISENPKKDFFNLHNELLAHGFNDISVSPSIDSSARIADTVKIYDFVRIGKNVIIEDYTVINSNTIIEDDTYIGQNVVIGARGMNNTMIDREFIRVNDAGGVHIGKQCEILAGAVIQKSYFSEFTKISNNTKISVGVKVGHGCIIGERTLIAGNAQIAGYVTIGDDVWIGPSAIISHGLTIASNAEVKIGSVVVKNVKENEVVSGNFAYNHLKRIRNFAKEQK